MRSCSGWPHNFHTPRNSENQTRSHQWIAFLLESVHLFHLNTTWLDCGPTRANQYHRKIAESRHIVPQMDSYNIDTNAKELCLCDDRLRVSRRWVAARCVSNWNVKKSWYHALSPLWKYLPIPVNLRSTIWRNGITRAGSTKHTVVFANSSLEKVSFSEREIKFPFSVI